MLVMTIYSDIREEGSDCKKCYETPHNVIATTGTADRAFIHVDILYTSFHSLPIQNFDSTRVKANWFMKQSWVLSMASSLWVWWSSGIWCIFLQQRSPVPFRWIHKWAKLQLLEFGEPSCFSMLLHQQKIGIWCNGSRKRVVGPIFFETTITAEVYHDINQQFTALLRKDEHNPIFQQDN